MAKYSNTVEYNIKTTLDSAGITKLQAELSKAENQFRTMRNQGLVGRQETQEAVKNIGLIRDSLNKAFNGKLGMLDNRAFLANLQKNGQSLMSIGQSFSKMGSEGTAAFTRMYGQISRIDTGLKQVSSTSDKIMNTLGNTVRWGLIASAFSTVMNAAHQSVQYVKDLDQSLTNIMMVSGESKDNMNEFAKAANEVAIRLGGTTTQMTEATKVFVQQGMNLSQSSQMAEYAVHLANISEQDSSTTSDELTAMKNAFGLQIEDMGNAVSKWAVIANNAAVSMEELSVASQKAASVANTVGVDMEQFAGHIAAIEATTREAPENIGNGLKTLYSRIADIKLGDTLEDGVNYGQFSSALKKIGVDVLDVDGKMKDAGIIIEEIMAKWEDLDKTQRNAVATTVAGRFQLARFEALMNSQDIYKKSVGVARAETGTETYDRMQDTYRESLEGRSKALEAEIERIFLNAFDTDNFYALVDATTQLVHVFGDLIEAIGGGTSALTAMAAFLTKSFSSQIGRGISNFISNRETASMAAQNKASVEANAAARLAAQGVETTGNKNMDTFVRTTAAVNQHASILNPEQIRLVNAELQKYEEQIIALDALQKQNQELSLGVGAALEQLGMKAEVAEKGAIELALALEKTDGDLEKAKGILENSGFLKLINQVENAQTKMVQFGDMLDGISAKGEADWDKLQNGARKLQNELVKLKSRMSAAGGDTTKIAGAIEQLNKMITGDVKSMKEFKAALREAGIDANTFREGLMAVFEGCEKIDGTLKKNAESLAVVGAGAEATRQKLMGMSEQFNMQYVATQVVNLGSALMSLTFTLQSINALFEVWNNEDLNIFEKLEQSLLNVSMLLVMGIPMIGQFRTALAGIGDATLAYALKQELANKVTEEEIAAQAADGATIGVVTAEKEALVISSIKEAAAKGDVTLATLAEIGAQNSLTLAQVLGIAATEGLGVAFKALWVALLESPLAPIAAACIAVGVAIAGIVTIVQAAEAHYKRFDTAVEETTDALRRTSSEVKEAKEKVDDLNTALEGLKDNPFEGLTKGTQEWNQALIEANEKVLELLEKYPELAQYVQKGNNGELTFGQEGLEEYVKQSQQALAQAQGEAAKAKIEQGQAKANQMAANSLRTNAFAGFRSAYSSLDYVGGGEAVTAQVNYNEDAAVAKLQEVAVDVANRIGDVPVEDLEAELAEMGITGENVVENLARLGNDLQANTAAVDSATQAYAMAAMATNDAYQNASTQAQNAIDTRLANALGEDYTYDSENEQVRNAVSKFDNSALSWDDQSLQNWYAEKKGYSYNKDKNRFYDKDNNEVQGLNYDDLYNEIRDAYIADAIVDEFNERAEEIAAPIDEAIENVTKKGGDELASIFAGEGQINGSAIQGLGTDITELDLSSLSMDDLRALGFNSYEEFKIAFEEASANNPAKATIDTGSKYDFDNDEEINSYLENNTNIDRGVLDSATSTRMEEHEEKGNRFTSEDINKVTKAQEKLNDAIEEYGENSEQATEAEENLAEARKDTSKDTKLYEKAVQRAAAAEARQIKTIEEMNKHFDDNRESLLNAEKGSIEYAEALSETKEDLAGLLDIDADKLSDGFTASAHTLDLMKQAAEGNEEAFRDLQALAAEDVIKHLEIDTTDAEGNPIDPDSVRQTLTDMVNDLNSQELGVDVEADIDTSGWYARINELLASGAITADQLTQTLSAAGYEAEIDYIETDGTVPAVAYTLHVGGSQHIGDDKSGIDFPSEIEMEPHITNVPTKIQAPVLKGATQKGGVSGAAAAAGGRGGGGKGGGGGCFIAGTPISFDGYYKPIETVQIGDIVLSYNEELKQNEYSEVLETMIHLVKEELYTLHIEDEKLTATGIHRFLINRNEQQEWIPASDLQINDLVLFADYSWHKITQIDIEVKATRVYNFEVSNNHNYYVGRNQILAHNKGGGGSGGKKNEPKETSRAKSAEVENDIYQKVNATLEKLNDQYSKLDKITSRIWGKDRRKNVEEQLTLLNKEKTQTKERIKIAQAYLKALQSGKSNSAYGISMKDKPSMKDTGLVDKDKDGVIDNYIQKFEQARKAAQNADDAADAYYKKHGGKIDKNGNVITEAKMTEEQQKEYEKLTKNAEKLWKKAEDINTVQKEYEDTQNQIREDNEKLVEIMQQQEDLQIDLYERALEAADTLKDIKDTAADLKGFFSGFGTDSPFRSLLEDSQRFQDIMSGSEKELNNYYNDIIARLKAEQDGVNKNSAEYKKYADALKFYQKEKEKYSAGGEYGTGELAQAAAHLDELKRWMDNPNSIENPYGTNTEDLYNEYKEYYKKVADLILEAEERMEAVQESILDAYENMANRQDKLLNQYDRINEKLERASDRVSLWQGDEAYQAQADIAKQQAKTSLEAAKSAAGALSKYRAQLAKAEAQQEKDRVKKVAEAEKQITYLKQQLNKDKNNKDLQEQLAAAETLLVQAKYDDNEEVKWLKQQINDTTDYIEDKQDEAAEAFKNAYENVIDELALQTNKKLFGDRDLNLITNDWERDKEYYNNYKDEVETATEKEKLRLKYQQLLQDNLGSSLKVQRQIRNAMTEQLALLEDQDTLSQYDVDLANARLEILQKQIALENAQQNKNQMKLRRDTQGNYKYVYAADQGDIGEKQADLLESQFDAYEMSKNAYAAAYDAGISLYNNYITQRTELEKKYGNDAAKLEEELAKLNADYLRDSQANAEDLQDTYSGMVLSVEWMAKTGTEAIQDMTKDVLEVLQDDTHEALESIGIAWNPAIEQGLTDLTNIQDAITETCEAAITESKAYIDFITNPTDGVGAVTNTAFGEAESAIKDAEQATKDLTTATSELFEIMDADSGAIDKAKEKVESYKAALETAKNSASTMASNLAATQTSLNQKTAEANQWKTTAQNYKENLQSYARMLNGNFKKGDIFKIKAGTTVYYGRDGWQKDEKGRASYTTKKDLEVIVQNPKQYNFDGKGNLTGTLAEHHVGFFPTDGQGFNCVGEDKEGPVPDRINEQWHLKPELLSKAMTFATGGYTGNWEKSEGKVGILHQKELILNKTDTKNILTAVELVRQTTDMIKTSAVTDVIKNTSRFGSSEGRDTIEQRVSITAEFPGVNDAIEIKQALLNLADSAMQYAYRDSWGKNI